MRTLSYVYISTHRAVNHLRINDYRWYFTTTFRSSNICFLRQSINCGFTKYINTLELVLIVHFTVKSIRFRRMADNNFSQQRESDLNSESNEGSYENYRRSNLPEGYTPYRENGQATEAVYDRYDSAYTADESGKEPKSCSCIRNESCKIGWLLK